MIVTFFTKLAAKSRLLIAVGVAVLYALSLFLPVAVARADANTEFLSIYGDHPMYQDNAECGGGSAAATGTNSNTASGKAFLIGDSIAEGTSTQITSALKSKGFSDVVIDAKHSRTLSQGLTILDNKTPYQDAKTVIVELGTNGGFDAANIKATVDKIKAGATGAKIFWVNIGADNTKRTTGDPINTDALNATLSQNVSAGYAIIDWAAQVKAHPDYISGDGYGVHASAAGAQPYANTIAAGVTGAGISATNNNSGGQNCACGVAGSSGSIPADGEKRERGYKFFLSLGFSNVQAAGIMGNLILESQLDPKITNGIGAYGLAQWLGGRKSRLQAMPNYDTFETQLEFIKVELESTHKAAMTATKAATTVEGAVKAWENNFEISGEAGMPERIKYANEVFTAYGNQTAGPAGSTSSGGGGCTSGAAAGNASELANKIAQTGLGLAWKEKKDGLIAQQDATPAYQEAMQKYNGATNTSNCPPSGLPNQWSDCGVFVATVMHMSGADTNYPKRLTTNMIPYLKAHPEKYEIIDNVTDSNQLKPGDIIINSHHVMIYVGPQPQGPGILQGFNTIDASICDRVPGAKVFGPHPSGEPYMAARIKG